MIDLPEKTLVELESVAQRLRELIAQDPQHSRAELQDVEWEIEKRQWRSEAQSPPNGRLPNQDRTGSG